MTDLHDISAAKYIHALNVAEEFVIGAIVDDLVIRDQKRERRKRRDHQGLGETDNEHGALDW
jgi:hypothetical protein